MEKESPDFFRRNDCLLSFFADLFHVAIGFFLALLHNMSVISFLYTYNRDGTTAQKAQGQSFEFIIGECKHIKAGLNKYLPFYLFFFFLIQSMKQHLQPMGKKKLCSWLFCIKMNERSEEIEIQNWNDKINFVFIHKISMFFWFIYEFIISFLLVPVLSCAIQYAYWGKFYNRPIGKWRCDDINHNITSDKKKEMLAVRNKTSSHKWKFLRYFICAFLSFYIRTKQKVLAATWKQFRVAAVVFFFHIVMNCQ